MSEPKKKVYVVVGENGNSNHLICAYSNHEKANEVAAKATAFFKAFDGSYIVVEIELDPEDWKETS